MTSAEPKVVILLATWNGAQFLPGQLESYRAQTHSNWALLVSDDGSTDGTVDLIIEFADSVSQPVMVREGGREGFWQNFLSLVRTIDIDGDLFAYSDQDDIWFPEKLERAVAWFDERPANVPALFFARTALIERDGKPAGLSPLFKRAATFQNALVQNIGGGNTMVFNRAARDVLAATPLDISLVAHDWWTYQLVTGVGGIAHYDPRPSLQYRQHGQNLIGSNVGLRARLVRLSAFLRGRVVRWNDINMLALHRMRHLMHPASLATLDRFEAARRATLPRRLYLVARSGVYRQSLVENVGLIVGSLFGRL